MSYDLKSVQAIRVSKFLTMLALLTSFSLSAQAEIAACLSLFKRTEAQITHLGFSAFNVQNIMRSVGAFDWVRPGDDMLARPADPRREHYGSAMENFQKLEEIRNMIARGNDDFVILTEVEDIEAMRTLLAQGPLQGLYDVYLTEGNDPRGIDIGFLVKKDLPWNVRQISHKDIRWRDPVDGREGPLFTRDLPVLEFRRSPNDEPPLFVLMGHHAKSKRDRPTDPESTRWRSAQFREAARIAESYEYLGVPVIGGGDFNADHRHDPELEPLRRVSRSSLAHAPDALPEDQRITHTYHPFDGPTHYSQMDDILISPGLIADLESARIIRYRDARGNLRPLPTTYEERSLQPSDHFMVRIRLATRRLFGL